MQNYIVVILNLFQNLIRSRNPLRREASKFGMTFLILITFNFSLLTFNLSRVAAFTMSNTNYILEMGDFMTASGKPTGTNYKLGVSLGQTGPGLYSGTNYKAKLGFQYVYPIVGFRFSISETSIDFGSLSPTNPVSRTNTLTVSNGSGGYTVTGNEDHELTETTSGELIPNTTCDNGSCSETTSAAWANTLTYGFGYRCDNVTGTDCASGFSDETYYKQFADKSKSASDSSVMSNQNVSRSKQAKITYKVNIAGTQPAGTYTNKITYIATPTF